MTIPVPISALPAGRARQLVYQGLDLGPVSWRFRPHAMLLGRLEYRLELQHEAFACGNGFSTSLLPLSLHAHVKALGGHEAQVDDHADRQRVVHVSPTLEKVTVYANFVGKIGKALLHISHELHKYIG